MKEFHRSNRRGSVERSQFETSQRAISQRENDYARRQQRARRHLERIRREPQSRPSLSVVVPAAIAVSLTIGALFGSPLVAKARSWIGGEAVRLEAISIRGAEHLSLTEIAESTGLPPGAEWRSIDPRKVEASLIEHPWIADASVVRLPTGRLLIHVTEQIPRALVALAKPTQDFAVNLQGMPFAPVDNRVPTGLPLLIPSGAVERAASLPIRCINGSASQKPRLGPKSKRWPRLRSSRQSGFSSFRRRTRKWGSSIALKPQ